MDIKLKIKNFILNKVMNMPNIKIYSPNQVNNLKLSEHFNGNEFDCNHCHNLIIDYNLIDKLELLRQKLGVPICITSGYRCKTWNCKCNGSGSSRHLFGDACDFNCNGKISTMKVLDALHNIFGCRFGIYQSGVSEDLTYYHCDVSTINKSMWIGRKVSGKNQYTYYNDYNSLLNALKNDKKINWTSKWC